MGLGDFTLLFPGRLDGAFVHDVFQIRAGGVGSALGDVFQVHVSGQGLALGMHLQDGHAAVHVGIIHGHLPVKPSGAQQRRVQNIPPVGGGHHDNAFVGGKAVHFNQQLVQRLFSFVVPAAEASAAVAANGVDFIDEHDAGRIALCLLKQIAHAAGAYAHEHFHKVGTGDREERHVGFTGHSLGQQRFAGAGRAHQQHALGNACAKVRILFGVLEEINDLFKLFLFFVRARNISKGHLVFAGVHHRRAGFAEVHHPSAAAGLLAHNVPPHHHQQHDGDQVRQNLHVPGGDDGRQVLDLKPKIVHRYRVHVLAQLIGRHGEHGVVKIGADGGLKVIIPGGIIRTGHRAVFQPAHKIDPPDGNPVHFALFDQR